MTRFILAVLLLSSCGTVSKSYVTDVRLKPDGTLAVDRCTVEYDKFFGTAESKDCVLETPPSEKK